MTKSIYAKARGRDIRTKPLVIVNPSNKEERRLLRAFLGMSSKMHDLSYVK